MTRSKSGIGAAAIAGELTRSRVDWAWGGGFREKRPGWILGLATVFPSNQVPENNVKASESSGHEVVGTRREKQCHCSGGHETGSHDGDKRDGENTSGDDGATIDYRPDAGKHGGEASAIKDHGDDGSGGERREKAEGEFAAGTRAEGNAEAMGFVIHGNTGDGGCKAGFDDPDGDPGQGRGLPRRDWRGYDGGEAEDDLSPTRDGGKRARPLEGFTNETEIFEWVVQEIWGRHRNGI